MVDNIETGARHFVFFAFREVEYFGNLDVFHTGVMGSFASFHIV